MAFKVDENHLSPAARDFLNNAKSKAKAVRIAIEAFVVNEGAGGIYISEDMKRLNDKLDLILKNLTSQPVQEFQPEMNVVAATETDAVINAKDKAVKDISEKVQMKPSLNEAKPVKPDVSLVNIKAERNDEEDELMKLALSSIHNIIDI